MNDLDVLVWKMKKKYRQSTPVKAHLKFEFQVRHSIYVIELVVNRTSVPTKAGPASAVA